MNFCDPEKKVRIMTFSKYGETRQLFTTLKIMNICELNQYCVRWYPGEVQLTRGIPALAKKKKKLTTEIS